VNSGVGCADLTGFGAMLVSIGGWGSEAGGVFSTGAGLSGLGVFLFPTVADFLDISLPFLREGSFSRLVAIIFTGASVSDLSVDASAVAGLLEFILVASRAADDFV